jgi:hypothetical protein
MSDSNFVAHFTKGEGEAPFDKLVSILTDRRLIASSIPWTKNPAVCFTECPWSSLLRHVGNYSPYGVGFTKPHVFAAGGGPAYYVRADHWEKQNWDEHVKTFVTPFWPAYRPKGTKFSSPLSGKTIDYAHEREWRVPHDFLFQLDQVQFVVLPSYEEMARFPKELKDGIGRQKFILVDVYRHIETLWPTHVTD